MPTIADNVRSMAALVAEVKKDHKLTENTVMRIIDMNFALAQGAGINSLSGGEEIPSLDDAPIPFPSAEQMTLFEDEEVIPNDDDEALATVEHKELN